MKIIVPNRPVFNYGHVLQEMKTREKAGKLPSIRAVQLNSRFVVAVEGSHRVAAARELGILLNLVPIGLDKIFVGQYAGLYRPWFVIDLISMYYDGKDNHHEELGPYQWSHASEECACSGYGFYQIDPGRKMLIPCSCSPHSQFISDPQKFPISEAQKIMQTFWYTLFRADNLFYGGLTSAVLDELYGECECPEEPVRETLCKRCKMYHAEAIGDEEVPF